MVFLKWNCRVNWFWNVQIPRKKMARARTGTIPLLPCCQWDRVMAKHGLVLFYLLHFGLQKIFWERKTLCGPRFGKPVSSWTSAEKVGMCAKKAKKRKKNWMSSGKCVFFNISENVFWLFFLRFVICWF